MPFSRRRAALALLSSVSAFSPGLAHAEDEAPAIIVYGRPHGYAIDDTATATKTDTALIDVPQSISVLSREQLDDQGVEQLGDALRYVPGVVLGQGEGHRDQVTMRGQNSTADFFLDGLRDDAQYYRPLYNIERVEVLKGANALIFGRGGGGGVINRVSKAPRFSQARADLAGGVDTFGAWSLAADLGGPLAAGLGSRLSATYESFRNHRTGYDGHFLGITPTLGLRLGDATSLAATYEYVEDQRITDRGVPSLYGSPLTGFDRTLFGDRAANTSAVTAQLAHARMDHQLTDSLAASVLFQFGHYAKRYANVYPRGAVSAGQVEFEGYANETARENWIGQANLVWRGSTGAVAHTLLLGAEIIDQDTADARRLADFAGTATGRIWRPLGSVMTFPAITYGARSRSVASKVRAASFYLQDQIDLGDHVKLVGGLRYDDLRITVVNLLNGTGARRSDGKWSPRVGLIVKPRPDMSVYAAYSLSFLPQSGDQFTALDATSATLAPESFRNLEAGLKWDLTDRLALTLAAYRLDRTNSRYNDPVSGPLLTGKTRTHGVEAALVGQVSDRLQLTLGYARQDGDVRSATTAAPAGRRLAQLPRHQATAWARYDFSDRFGLGLGIAHQSSQFATISNAVRLPAFTRIDAAAFVTLSKSVSIQLNIENLTDADYFPSAHTDNNITPGEPLNARLTARARF